MKTFRFIFCIIFWLGIYGALVGNMHNISISVICLIMIFLIDKENEKPKLN